MTIPIFAKFRPHLMACLLSGTALSAALSASTAMAQDFEHVAPKPPPVTATPTLQPPKDTAPPSDDQTVLIPDLKGVLFVPAPESIQPAGVAPETVPEGVVARGLPLLDDPAFLDRIKPYLNKPLTRAGLDAIGRLARTEYGAHDRLFVDVSVPPQSVERGVVQIIVTEYRVGEIHVEGNRYFSEKRIRRLGDLESGDALSLPTLRGALDHYNSNPFLTVSAVASPGASTGLTNITLQAQDRLPFRAYAGYDNQGVRTLGTDEWYVGFNWGNAFGTGQVLSYQFTRSFSGRYTSHSLSDVIPVNANNRFWVFGAYATQAPDLGPYFGNDGHSGQLSFRYVHDLPRLRSVSQSLQIGVDFKRTDNNLEFLGFRLLNTQVELYQLPVTYTATITDRFGQTVIENLFVLSPGNVTEHNSDEALRLLVPYADASYAYDRLSVTRTTALGAGFSWIIRAMAQQATSNLPYSEQIGGGGIGSIRGYDSNTALGSEGLLASMELRTPVFSAPGGQDDRMQFGLFWDYAHLRQYKALPDLPPETELASIGMNMHYNLDRYFNIQLELGAQLEPAPGFDDRDIKAAIVTTVGF